MPVTFKEKYHAYIKSSTWRELKLDLINLRGDKCQYCGRQKPINKLHIHHLTYDRIFNERAEDLVVICAICHMKEHGLIKEQPKPVKPTKKFKKKQKPKSKQSNIDKVVAKYKNGRYKNLKEFNQAYQSAARRCK